MRNLKKFLALVLAMLMVVSAAATVSAFDDVSDSNKYIDAIEDLVDKGIITGFSSTEFKPDEKVTRWQFALMLVKGYTGIIDSSDWVNGVPLFDDITNDQYIGAIGKAVGAGIIKGTTATTFAPKDTVTYAEALTMAVRALGFETKDKDGVVNMTYPTDYLAAAMEHGLTKNLSISDKNQPLTRAETAQIIYNLMYAERKDNVKTFAEQNFDEVGANNYDTFVISGTVKQSLIDETVDVDDASVILTKLDENGNFDQNIYVTCKDLGINFDKIEEMIGQTVLLVNYNEKKETFAKAIVQASKVITNSSVSDKTENKIAINGKTYYIVDDFTDTKIRNELMLFNSANKLKVMEKSALTGNYQLVLFDDDLDGIYDRGIFNPIYVSVFNKINSDSKDETAGVWGTAKDKKNVYSETLTKGDVFTYTYNPMTLGVNVLDILDYTTGKLTKINTTNNNSDGKYAINLTIDGVVYTLDNANRETLGLTGANLKSTTFDHFNNIKGRNAADNGDVVPAIGFQADHNALTLGADVRFYAIDNQIIYVSNVPGATTTEVYAVIKEATGYDTSTIYFDMYVGGKLVEDVPVVKVGDKKLADLTSFALTSELSRITNDNFKLGSVVKVVKNSNGTYNIVGANPLTAPYAITELDVANNSYFKGGIADRTGDADSTMFADQYALRTNDSTAFYFLKVDTITGKITKVDTFLGVPANASVIKEAAKIYANKFGFGTAISGIASAVIVEYTDIDQVSGFGGVVTPVNTDVTMYIDSDITLNYTKVLGSELGLTGDNATKTYFTYNIDKLAINMNTGSVITTVYSLKALEAGKFYTYKTNSTTDGVALDPLSSANLNAASFVEGRYWTINNADSTNLFNASATITNVYVTKQNEIAIKTSLSDIKALLGTNTYDAYYKKTGSNTLVIVLKNVVPTTKSFNVAVTGLAASTNATVYLTQGGADVAGKTLTFIADGTQSFTELDITKTFAIRVIVAAGYVATPVWNAATNTYTVTITTAVA